MADNRKLDRMEKVLLIIVILLLVVFIRRTYDLGRRVKDFDIDRTTLLERISRLDKKSYQSYLKLLDGFEEEGDIIKLASKEVGKVDEDDLMVNVIYKIIPKEVTENTKVFLDFSNEVIEMEEKDGFFSLEKNIDIFDEYKDGIKVIIENGDVSEVINNRNLDSSFLYSSILPKLYGESFKDLESKKGYYILEDSIALRIEEGKYGKGFKELYLVTEVDNQQNSRERVDPASIRIEINEKIKMESGQVLVLKLVGIDDFGLRHEYFLDTYKYGGRTMGNRASLFIYDKNNKLAYDSNNYY